MKPTGMCKGQHQEDVFLRVQLCQSYQTTAIRRIWECANDLKRQKLNIPEIDNDSAELGGCNYLSHDRQSNRPLIWNISSSSWYSTNKKFEQTRLMFDLYET